MPVKSVYFTQFIPVFFGSVQLKEKVKIITAKAPYSMTYALFICTPWLLLCSGCRWGCLQQPGGAHGAEPFCTPKNRLLRPARNSFTLLLAEFPSPRLRVLVWHVVGGAVLLLCQRVGLRVGNAMQWQRSLVFCTQLRQRGRKADFLFVFPLSPVKLEHKFLH